MIASCGRIGAWVMQVQGAYLETPGLTVRLPDALRQFQLDAVTCEAVLGAFVDASVLNRTPEGADVRAVPRPVLQTSPATSPRRRRQAGPRHGNTSPSAVYAP